MLTHSEIMKILTLWAGLIDLLQSDGKILSFNIYSTADGVYFSVSATSPDEDEE